MTDDQPEPAAEDSPEPTDAPPEAREDGRRPLAFFSLPDWFRQRPPGQPFTPEEDERLKAWFAEQLRQRPLRREDFKRPEDHDD
jgi:hypothetical protein